MGKLWDFLMRRKPLCLAVLAVFGASFALSNWFLAEQMVLSRTPVESHIGVSGPSTDMPSSTEVSSAPELTDLPAINELGSVSEIEPSGEINDNIADDSPLVSSEPTPVEKYFTVVTSPRDVAMLNLVAVPRTGGEVPTLGLVAENGGYGIGSNLPGDMASDADFVSSAISAATSTDAQPSSKRFGFWSGFFVTFSALAALIILFALATRLLC